MTLIHVYYKVKLITVIQHWFIGLPEEIPQIFFGNLIIQMNTIIDPLKQFFVVTASGGVYEVCYTKMKTTVKKIFAKYPKKSKAKVGYEFFPKGKFVCITKTMGLWKCHSDNGKKFQIEDHWDGNLMQTSPIVGLFFEKDQAINYCTDAEGAYKTDYHFMNWYRTNGTSKEVLEKIGKDHPVFILSKELQPQEEGVPF